MMKIQSSYQESSVQVDERGMARLLGPDTWSRCAPILAEREAQCYELSHMVSNTMPSSPFAERLRLVGLPTAGVPGTRHVGNRDTVTGEATQQGTHMDALGHFGVLPGAWSGANPIPVAQATYYSGLTQAEVKPDPNKVLARLGIENVPPIITTAVLLDAELAFGAGAPLPAGFSIEAEHIETAVHAQGLTQRGILPGDVVYIHTGWGKLWSDPAEENSRYYREGPGLGISAAVFLASKEAVLVALDNPFTDPVNSGQLTGSSRPPEGMPQGLPFGSHHLNLTKSGILQMQNVTLTELVKDRVWASCTIILPLRLKGCSGSPVRPIAIGKPWSCPTGRT
jgi:kynurenine formamidase